MVTKIPLWNSCATAVNEVLPKALVVVDKFHIVKMANEQMDSARKYFYKSAPHGLKKSKSLFLMREDKLTEKAIANRDAWFEQYPKLKTAYELKESFYRIYDCSTRFEAERAFREWQWQIPKDTDFNGWRLMASTVRRHRKTIFNYFDTPYTNAFVEGLNNVIRRISDEGRGYDFDVLRGRVLLSAGRKIETPKTDFDHMTHWNQSVIKDYGAAFEDILEAVKRGLI